MVSAWTGSRCGNRRVAATFLTAMSYADTAGHTDSFVAVFDEQYEVLAVIRRRRYADDAAGCDRSDRRLCDDDT